MTPQPVELRPKKDSKSEFFSRTSQRKAQRLTLQRKKWIYNYRRNWLIANINRSLKSDLWANSLCSYLKREDERIQDDDVKRWILRHSWISNRQQHPKGLKIQDSYPTVSQATGGLIDIDEVVDIPRTPKTKVPLSNHEKHDRLTAPNQTGRPSPESNEIFQSVCGQLRDSYDEIPMPVLSPNASPQRTKADLQPHSGYQHFKKRWNMSEINNGERTNQDQSQQNRNEPGQSTLRNSTYQEDHNANPVGEVFSMTTPNFPSKNSTCTTGTQCDDLTTPTKLKGTFYGLPCENNASPTRCDIQIEAHPHTRFQIPPIVQHPRFSNTQRQSRRLSPSRFPPVKDFINGLLRNGVRDRSDVGTDVNKHFGKVKYILNGMKLLCHYSEGLLDVPSMLQHIDKSICVFDRMLKKIVLPVSHIEALRKNVAKFKHERASRSGNNLDDENDIFLSTSRGENNTDADVGEPFVNDESVQHEGYGNPPLSEDTQFRNPSIHSSGSHSSHGIHQYTNEPVPSQVHHSPVSEHHLLQENPHAPDYYPSQELPNTHINFSSRVPIHHHSSPAFFPAPEYPQVTPCSSRYHASHIESPFTDENSGSQLPHSGLQYDRYPHNNFNYAGTPPPEGITSPLPGNRRPSQVISLSSATNPSQN